MLLNQYTLTHKMKSLRLALLFSCLAVVASATPIITINEGSSADYLDVTFDLSDGYMITESVGLYFWYQNDGIYRNKVEFMGWTIKWEAGFTAGGGGIEVRTPHQEVLFKGWTWSADFAFIHGDLLYPSYGFHFSDKAGFWEGEIPQMHAVGPLTSRVTWNIPDTTSTLSLFAGALLALAAVRRRVARSAS